MTRYLYRHHGFTLSSNEPLGTPLCVATSGPADIAVHALAPGQLAASELDWTMVDPPTTIWRAQGDRGSSLRLRYASAGGREWTEFVIDECGETVWVARADHVALEEVAELLFGPVFSCVLAQRGFTCLHAATVSVAGRVVALTGASGAGKSTTALGLVQRGGALISDDVAVLAPETPRPEVRSGAPRLRMRPDSAESLVGSYASLDPMWNEVAKRPRKRYLHVDESAAVADGTTWPLDVVYLLVPDDQAAAPALRTLTPSQAVGRLMSMRHMAAALDTVAHRRDFPVIAAIADSVPVRELRCPERLASAPDTVAAILDDLDQCLATRA